MPTEAIALSQPRAQLDPHFTLRPLRLDEDVAVINPWYQMDYAHYWNMQDMTLEATRDFYADALGSGHMRAFMGFYRGAPAFVMECYDPGTTRSASAMRCSLVISACTFSSARAPSRFATSPVTCCAR